MSRYRAFCLTCNNFTQAHVDMLKAMDTQYLVSGQEIAPSTGTPHLQAFIYLSNPKTLSAVVKALPGFHVEVKSQYSTFKQAIDYCKKEGDFYEQGAAPKDPKEKGEAEQARWEDMISAAEEGRFSDIPGAERVRFDSTWYRMRARAQKAAPPDVLSELEHEWHWGDPGTGKSRNVRAAHPGAYIKNANKWWDGYMDEDAVIIDDFDLKHDCLAYHLKIWADHYPFTAEVKGGSMFIRPRKIIVTSNFSPDQIFTDSVTAAAVRRRFKVTHYSAAFNK